MSGVKSYYAQFSTGHIETCRSKGEDVTHAYRTVIESPEGVCIHLYGFASSEEAARRAALNVLTRKTKTTGQLYQQTALEVVNVGMSVKRIGGDNERFLALYWKPKGMPKKWDKALHKRGRYLITAESSVSWHILIAGKEYKVSKSLGEIIWYDENGKRVTGGPIFVVVRK